MPLIKKAYEKYQNDPTVNFILVSLDDDPKRLDRFVADQKFPMTVTRGNQEEAEQRYNIFDVPATFYIDGAGIVRFEARGMNLHGEGAERVAWFIEELKKRTE